MSNAFPFAKMQGVGNDFVVVNARDLPPDADFPALSAAVADRKFGIGSDGLMVLLPSEVADIRARMFNPDGTEDFCGNGTRCLARLAYESGQIGASATIETKAGLRTLDIGLTNEGLFCEATLSMGKARFAPAELPMLAAVSPVRDFPLDLGEEIVRVSVVSTGTTHAVVWHEKILDDERFSQLSPLIENHPLFPERTSVMWTQIVGPRALGMHIWERGAGETLGCGSGACAAATLARLEDKIKGNGPVAVRSQGGTLTVHWRDDDPHEEIFLTGPAETVYSGVWEGGT